jgi:adenine-specific DNA-methyltransferase
LKKIIRYIGSKEKLLNFLDEVAFSKYKKIKLLDGFTGTTIVSKHIQETTDFDLYMSDISDYSEILSSRLYLSKCTDEVFIYLKEVINLTNLTEIQKLKNSLFFNEFSINGKPKTIDINRFENQTVNSRMFFTEDVGIKIDVIRKYIKDLYKESKVNYYERNLLLMTLVAFVDKNANTTSVYGAYLKKQNRPTRALTSDFYDIIKKDYDAQYKAPLGYYKGDILTTLKSIPELDVVYLDPPYNTRRYESNYHILNYICQENFSAKDIKKDSKTGLPKNSIKNMFSSKKDTRIIYKEMISNSMEKAKELFISYSTDGEMSFEEINDFCSDSNLDLLTYTKDYKRFKSKENDNKNDLKEIVYRIKRN